jgi:hypothetical protein
VMSSAREKEQAERTSRNIIVITVVLIAVWRE